MLAGTEMWFDTDVKVQHHLRYLHWGELKDTIQNMHVLSLFSHSLVFFSLIKICLRVSSSTLKISSFNRRRCAFISLRVRWWHVCWRRCFVSWKSWFQRFASWTACMFGVAVGGLVLRKLWTYLWIDANCEYWTFGRAWIVVSVSRWESLLGRGLKPPVCLKYSVLPHSPFRYISQYTGTASGRVRRRSRRFSCHCHYAREVFGLHGSC
jgi:hypothetical protein